MTTKIALKRVSRHETTENNQQNYDMSKLTKRLYTPPQLEVELYSVELGFQTTGSITESGDDTSIADPDDTIIGWD